MDQNVDGGKEDLSYPSKKLSTLQPNFFVVEIVNGERKKQHIRSLCTLHALRIQFYKMNNMA